MAGAEQQETNQPTNQPTTVPLIAWNDTKRTLAGGWLLREPSGRQASASAANGVEKGCFERREPEAGCYERRQGKNGCCERRCRYILQGLVYFFPVLAIHEGTEEEVSRMASGSSDLQGRLPFCPAHTLPFSSVRKSRPCVKKLKRKPPGSSEIPGHIHQQLLPSSPDMIPPYMFRRRVCR